MFETPLVSEQVYEWLKERILFGTLVPGQRIIVDELVEQIGVSRTPILEALKRLAFDRLVVVSPRRGTVVRHLTNAEIDELYEANLILLPAVCEFVGANASDELIEDLEDIYREQLALDPALIYTDHAATHRYLELNAAMHKRIIAETGNDSLKRVFEQLRSQNHIASLVFGSDFMGARRRIAEKKLIIEAMKRRDGPAAAEAMRVQLLNSRQDFADFVESQRAKHPSDSEFSADEVRAPNSLRLGTTVSRRRFPRADGVSGN